MTKQLSEVWKIPQERNLRFILIFGFSRQAAQSDRITILNRHLSLRITLLENTVFQLSLPVNPRIRNNSSTKRTHHWVDIQRNHTSRIHRWRHIQLDTNKTILQLSSFQISGLVIHRKLTDRIIFTDLEDGLLIIHHNDRRV